MKISKVRVYGLEESIIASGYPMKTEIFEEYELTPKDTERAIRLGQIDSGTGHDCYLKGIVVQFNLTAPEYFWRQIDRYHYTDYISSQSKMHNLLKFDLNEVCNDYVDYTTIQLINNYINLYNNYSEHNKPYNRNTQKYMSKEEIYKRIISNCPMGIELTARRTTNYLQEKTIHLQRKNHKLEEWQYYCNWQKTLPKFEELILGECIK